MEYNYSNTEKYWESVFSKQCLYNPYQKLPYSKIEQALKWLAYDSESIIDFGCGDGRLLSRCLDYGVKNIYGIDISDGAVNLARKVMKGYYLEKRSSFVSGDIKILSNLAKNSYDGAILSNIIDNILPDDADKVLTEIYRILKPAAKVIIKLNPYYNPQELKDNNGYIKISDNLYKENSGLYLYNISDELFASLIKPFMNIAKKEVIKFKEYDMINRIYYMNIAKV